MSKVIEQKQQVVQEIADKLENSVSTIVVDYRGLDVAEATELRKQLREAGVDFKVYKNTMVRRATEKTNLTEIDEHLVGPTAVATSTEDVVAPAKVLNNFAKDHEQLEIKTGVIQGRVASLDEIKELASLPSHDGLVSMLLSVLQAPIRNFALASKAVADQKEEEGA
ncbi:50S ribosomal protein L10 [Alteribacillus sp. JSM 102045]|uniref:50S ribosomal protein L10 n=1 Tax=Alteribacillus sp. JSM 102045 TaxID=1562101 RepID=UPI0035C06C21